MLTGYGHTLQVANSTAVGVTQIIAFDSATGIFTGAHDPRVPGLAAGSAVAISPPSSELQLQPAVQIVE